MNFGTAVGARGILKNDRGLFVVFSPIILPFKPDRE